MDFSTVNLTQYGIALIFIAWSWKLYCDMRDDSRKREDKLMEHLAKLTDTIGDISDTLQNIDMRICSLENNKKGAGGTHANNQRT